MKMPHYPVGRYKKNDDKEAFLERLNSVLGPQEELEYEDLPEEYPTIHVIGAPRSGTTLLLQLIISNLNVGYISNLVAAFWSAPVYGIRLARFLLPERVASSYQSDYGRTTEIHEPHEFGYFWREMLGYPDLAQKKDDHEHRIAWHRLRRVLINMTYACDAPIAFKSFLLAWHIQKMQQSLDKTCFLWIKRDPVENALSILRCRQDYLGNVAKWSGLRPLEYASLQDEPVWRQAAGQVYYIEKAISEQAKKVSGRNILTITYEDLCTDPVGVLRRTKELVGRYYNRISLDNSPPTQFTLRKVSTENQDYYEEVKEAVEGFYGQPMPRSI